MRRLLLSGATALCTTLLPVLALASSGMLATFDGNPPTPVAYRPVGWGVVVHQRDDVGGTHYNSLQAGHGPDCMPGEGHHTVSTYEDGVFQCRDHLMTAIDSGYNNYAAIYLTPGGLLDFSAGEAVLSFDVSTLRQSDRDWIDIWLTPLENYVQLPLESDLPDGQGEPKNAIHVRLRGDANGGRDMSSSWEATVIRNYESTLIQSAVSGGAGLEDVLASAGLSPSSIRRDTVEVRLNTGHLKVSMPRYGTVFVDSDLPQLGFNQAVVQLGHHSYSPTKGNPQPGLSQSSGPTTWHWDNVSLDPAVPLTIIPADQRVINQDTANVATFAQAAPAGATLLFQSSGTNPAVSFDDGQSWVHPVQTPSKLVADHDGNNHMLNLQVPIPAGTTHLLLRSEPYASSPHIWWDEDFMILARAPLATPPVPEQTSGSPAASPPAELPHDESAALGQ